MILSLYVLLLLCQFLPQPILLLMESGQCVQGVRHRRAIGWGDVPEPIGDKVSHTSGKILVGGGGAFPEAGYWRCTPGSWRCEVERDEFCHFLEGDCVYTHDGGEVIAVKGGDTAWFPAGWRGSCQVRETVAKVYLIR